jgi:hypothetical protein
MDMKYRGYLLNLARAFNYRFEQISTHYNFDRGDEFEIALCHVLREVLPQKYGVCRGFVTPADGASAGDDIIIYDSVRFPTLRLFPQESYEIKQDVPVEAVYAYVEAKHTLHIAGAATDGQSMLKATSQVAAVKSVSREPRLPDRIHPYFKSNVSYGKRPDWPPSLNPLFGAVVARQVKLQARGQVLEAAQATNALVGTCIGAQRGAPDLIVAGDSNLIVPCVQTPSGPIMHSPFYIQGTTASLQVMRCKDLAFAAGICILLYALDALQLGRMPWEAIIDDALKHGWFDTQNHGDEGLTRPG